MRKCRNRPSAAAVICGAADQAARDALQDPDRRRAVAQAKEDDRVGDVEHADDERPIQQGAPAAQAERHERHGRSGVSWLAVITNQSSGSPTFASTRLVAG
jgi:hypothetical protein